MPKSTRKIAALEEFQNSELKFFSLLFLILVVKKF